MQSDLRERVVASALWAAYGDALGFQTELASPSILFQRLGTERATELRPWKRLIGGKFGTTVELPAGTYSDDTQLRLSVSRAVRSDGHFDVEAFAKIELPIWLSYGLGSGRGTKAAAASLSARNINWFSNFFDSPGAVYIRGGGNGAAMRVQPHVWSARDLKNERGFMLDVVKNAVTTHGHVRAIGGAMVHASILAYVLREGELPPPAEWMNFAEVIQGLPQVVAEDVSLQSIWRPTWERLQNISLDSAALEVADEWAHAVGFATTLMDGEPQEVYRAIVEETDGLTHEERGSGLKAALYSLVAVWLMRDHDPKTMIETVANVLHSDTDTIATMAGAIAGALSGERPPTAKIQDYAYIEREAVRLHAISLRKQVHNFQYPDLLYWSAPKSPLDAVGRANGSFAVAGLGTARPAGDPIPSNPRGSAWQWFALEFGQSMFLKRRESLKQLPKEQLASALRGIAQVEPTITPDMFAPRPVLVHTIERQTALNASVQPLSPGSSAVDRTAVERRPEIRARSSAIPAVSLNKMTDLAIRSNFDATLIGGHLLELADEENGLELAVAYAAIIAKAKAARNNRG